MVKYYVDGTYSFPYLKLPVEHIIYLLSPYLLSTVAILCEHGTQVT